MKVNKNQLFLHQNNQQPVRYKQNNKRLKSLQSRSLSKALLQNPDALQKALLDQAVEGAI